MGVLDTGSAHARPSTRTPVDMSGIVSAHVSVGSHLHSEHLLGHLLGHHLGNDLLVVAFLAKPPSKNKNYPPGGPNIFGWLESL